MFLLKFLSLTRGILFFILLLCFKRCVRSGSVWFTWLKCGNNFAFLLQCNHCLEMFLLFFFFFFFSQAVTTMLAKRGTVAMRGCIGYHFDGLLM